jgi:hypothetical protein
VSSENVEIVRSVQPSGVDLVELVGPQESTLGIGPEHAELFADDFEVHFVSNLAELGRSSYHGLEGFLAGWRDWLEAWASYWIWADEFIDAGDRVVVLIRVEGKTARDAVTVTHEPAAVWTLADGRVIGIDLYLNRDDAFRGAGLSPQGSAGRGAEALDSSEA